MVLLFSYRFLSQPTFQPLFLLLRQRWRTSNRKSLYLHKPTCWRRVEKSASRIGRTRSADYKKRRRGLQKSWRKMFSRTSNVDEKLWPSDSYNQKTVQRFTKDRLYKSVGGIIKSRYVKSRLKACSYNVKFKYYFRFCYHGFLSFLPGWAGFTGM